MLHTAAYGYEPQQSRPESENIPQPAQSPTPTEIDKHTTPGSEKDEQMQPGYEPQQSSPQSESIPQVAREAFDDMVKMFLTQRKCVSVSVCYSLLQENTRAYLRSFGLERRTH